jgi:acyl carrier protein
MSDLQELMALLRSVVREVTEKPFPDVALDTPIAELGIDSISLAEIVLRIEDKLGLQVPATHWLRADTLQDILDAIQQAPRRPMGGAAV